MILSIHQPVGQALRYRAQVMDFDVPGSLTRASTYTVVPNGDRYDMWPEPITQVMVGEFGIFEPSSNTPGTCAY